MLSAVVGMGVLAWIVLMVCVILLVRGLRGVARDRWDRPGRWEREEDDHQVAPIVCPGTGICNCGLVPPMGHTANDLVLMEAIDRTHQGTPDICTTLGVPGTMLWADDDRRSIGASVCGNDPGHTTGGLDSPGPAADCGGGFGGGGDCGGSSGDAGG